MQQKAATTKLDIAASENVWPKVKRIFVEQNLVNVVSFNRLVRRWHRKWRRSTRRRSVRLLQNNGISNDAGSSALKSNVLSQNGVCPWRSEKKEGYEKRWVRRTRRLGASTEERKKEADRRRTNDATRHPERREKIDDSVRWPSFSLGGNERGCREIEKKEKW